jgi:hypothetical protein
VRATVAGTKAARGGEGKRLREMEQQLAQVGAAIARGVFSGSAGG